MHETSPAYPTFAALLVALLVSLTTPRLVCAATDQSDTLSLRGAWLIGYRYRHGTAPFAPVPSILGARDFEALFAAAPSARHHIRTSSLYGFISAGFGIAAAATLSVAYQNLEDNGRRLPGALGIAAGPAALALMFNAFSGKRLETGVRLYNQAIRAADRELPPQAD
jgi:hypothetical protein